MKIEKLTVNDYSLIGRPIIGFSLQHFLEQHAVAPLHIIYVSLIKVGYYEVFTSPTVYVISHYLHLHAMINSF